MAEASRYSWKVLLQAGDFDAICERMIPMLMGEARRYYVKGGSWDDLMQEAHIGLMKAVRDFRGTPDYFESFARMCVSRQLITAIKVADRYKHKPLNERVPFELPVTIVGTYGEVSVPLGDMLHEPDCDPHALLSQRTELLALMRRLHRLSDLERECLERVRLGGESYSQIRGHGVKEVDNAMQRAASKLARPDTPQIVERDVEVVVCRRAHPKRFDAILEARRVSGGTYAGSCRMAKLRDGRVVGTRGRAKADGRLGVPVWAVTVRVREDRQPLAA